MPLAAALWALVLRHLKTRAAVNYASRASERDRRSDATMCRGYLASAVILRHDEAGDD